MHCAYQSILSRAWWKAVPALAMLELAACDAEVAEIATPTPGSCSDSNPTVSIYYRDNDGDGFGDSAAPASLCEPTSGYALQPDDCDDNSPSVHPGAAELCNSSDDDCDQLSDEGLDQATYYPDGDGDGYGRSEEEVISCQIPAGYVTLGGDCEDDNEAVNPGALDECDGYNNDCDGDLDEDATFNTYYLDQDSDGYGSEDLTTRACQKPVGYTSSAGDCNDQAANQNPGQSEFCDGKDNNCDGLIDEAGEQQPYFRDTDNDGYGTDDEVYACSPPDGYAAQSGDCDDNNPAINPGATDVCDHQDNNCDHLVDEDAVEQTYYLDEDGDGYGVSDDTAKDCAEPEGYSSQKGDCDDGAATVNPGAAEACDQLDNDCDAAIDEQLQRIYYADEDGDGFGIESIANVDCQLAPGFAMARGDCDDQLETIYPGARDPEGDGIDADCGGTDAQEPSVGLSSSSYVTVQSAMEAADAGQTIWIGPGLYTDSALSFRGQGFLLISTHLAEQTIIDGQGQGPIFEFEEDEGASSIVDGFSIRGGEGRLGGAFYILGSSPVIRHCTVSDNSANYGAAFYISSGDPTVEYCTIRDNAASVGGGGIYLTTANAQISFSQVEENLAPKGAGLYLTSSDPILEDLRIEKNSATNDGSGTGGGIYMYGSTAILRRCFLSENLAVDDGGGAYISSSDPSFINCLLVKNQAGRGGALRLLTSNLAITQSVITDNSGITTGGGLYLADSNLSMVNSIVAYNDSYNVYSAESGRTYGVYYSALYNISSSSNHNLTTLDGSNTVEEPGFLKYDNAGLPIDWHLAQMSVLVDFGDPTRFDVDTSPADLGIFGGEAGGQWDSDRDGSFAWFWPGNFADWPTNVDGSEYDPDDSDPFIP